MPLAFLPLLGLLGLLLAARRSGIGWLLFSLRWAENQSRDTAENALLVAPLLQRDGI